jgi:hypothetical protein
LLAYSVNVRSTSGLRRCRLKLPTKVATDFLRTPFDPWRGLQLRSANYLQGNDVFPTLM